MGPAGAVHLGHYHGALKNRVRLQDDYDCLNFVAGWHALTRHDEDREAIEKSVYDLVVDWLAAGLDPEKSTLFIQSHRRLRPERRGALRSRGPKTAGTNWNRCAAASPARRCLTNGCSATPPSR
jgi:hypothetical protein